MNGYELGNGLSVFGNQDTVLVYSVEQRQALFLDFSGGYGFHN